MSGEKVVQFKIHLTEGCIKLADELQAEFGCESRGQLIEFLILSQRQSASEVRKMLVQRPKRGRRWPAKPEASEEE
jgi:hypothetical protein